MRGYPLTLTYHSISHSPTSSHPHSLTISLSHLRVPAQWSVCLDCFFISFNPSPTPPNSFPHQVSLHGHSQPLIIHSSVLYATAIPNTFLLSSTPLSCVMSRVRHVCVCHVCVCHVCVSSLFIGPSPLPPSPLLLPLTAHSGITRTGARSVSCDSRPGSTSVTHQSSLHCPSVSTVLL